MNTMVDYSQSELANPALRATHAGVQTAFLTNYRLRQIASDVAMLVAVLAFVLAFVALRMTLFAPPEITERVAIPAAVGGAVVFVLSLLGALALRHGDKSNRAT
jgi:hypothetical protein